MVNTKGLPVGDDFPKPLRLRVVYKGSVAGVVGKSSEEITISVGMRFIEVLGEIFLSHPEIEGRFPAGSLGLLLNDKPPTVDDVLHEDDVMTFIDMKGSLSA